MNTSILILAAGFGTRMNSSIPKVLHHAAGRSLIEWAVLTAETVSVQPPLLVVGHGREAVQASLGDRVGYVVQHELLGTGHAVLQAREALKDAGGKIVVVYGDMPLLRAETLSQLLTLYDAQPSPPAIAMLTVKRDDPQGFGRVVRDPAGNIQRIVEEVDCTSEEKAIRELNPGIYCFHGDWLWATIDQIPLNPKGEYFLTDMVGLAVGQGRRVVTMEAPADQVNGINTRSQLAQATAVLYQRTAERHMQAGVTLVDPATTYIDDTVKIGQDTIIWPGTLIQGETVIGTHCTIGPHSQIVQSHVGDGCRVTFSVLDHATMEQGSDVGPFSRLRSGAHLGPGAHVGNFAEIKNSTLGSHAKMGHMSYLGDAQVGANVNIGAGVITCNFDGEKKHPTVIEDDAFIGSDTMLVAPVRVGKEARTGAGSVVTRDIPDGATAYGTPARLHGPSVSIPDKVTG